MNDKKVYADNAATTRMSQIARYAMMEQIERGYGNPSSPCSSGRDARRALERARAVTARTLGARPEEIYFTSGGTESNNWAIKAAAERGGHVISTKIEHPSILNCLKYLEERGVEVTYLNVDKFSQLSPAQVSDAIRDDTALITIMLANNEIGTILPVGAIADIAREHGVLFHTDAVQAAGRIPLDVKSLGMDMLSISGHKFGAGRGSGALYVKKGVALPPFMHGGGQERGARSGTENTPGFCALASAFEDSVSRLDISIPRVTKMRDRLIDALLKIPQSHLTGDPANRLPGLASFAFDRVSGDMLVLALDEAGICASSGSACSAGLDEASHVLLATGLSIETARGSLRLSVNEDNNDREIDYIIAKTPEIIARLREMSPV